MEMGEYESFIKRLRNDGNYSYQNVTIINKKHDLNTCSHCKGK